MTIRPALTTDLPTIKQLNHFILAQNKTFNPDYIDRFADTPAGKKYFKEAIAHPDGCFFILEDDNKAVGFINGYPKPVSSWDSHVFEIDNLGILPNYQSQGLGTQLLNHVIDWAQQHGFDRILINTYMANTPAISFYKQHGFHPLDMSLIKSI
jgi:ribosomal protein S18 acetylase RimI-like enzyme